MSGVGTYWQATDKRFFIFALFLEAARAS